MGADIRYTENKKYLVIAGEKKKDSNLMEI